MKNSKKADVTVRVNPEFPIHMKRFVASEYNRMYADGIPSAFEIRAEISRVREALSEAIFFGEATEGLLCRREVFYLLAEDMGLM